MNVINGMLSLWMGTRKNPEATSSVENTVAPATLGAISSRLGNMLWGRFSAILRLLKSTQILMLPLCFTTGTIGAHLSVGSVTSGACSLHTIQLSLHLLLKWKWNSTCCCDAVRCDTSFNLIITGSVFKNPEAPNTFSLISSTRLTSPIC